MPSYKAADWSPSDRGAAVRMRAQLIADKDFYALLMKGDPDAAQILAKVSKAMLGDPQNFTAGKLTEEELAVRGDGIEP